MKKLFFILSLVLISSALCFSSCQNKQSTENDDDVNADTQIQENIENTENAETKEEQPSGILKNAQFEEALSTLLEKDVLTKEDLLSVYYIGVTPSSDGKFNLCIGLSDYLEAYYAELVKENPDPSALVPFAKDVDFVLEDGKNLDSDLAKLENVEIFEFYTLPVNDVTFIKNYPNLVYGYFSSNGIKDVSGLSDYNPEYLLQLDLSGNPIADWSPLKHLEDKVIVIYSFEDGSSVTLKEFNSMTSSQFPAEDSQDSQDILTQDAPEEPAPEQSAEDIGKQIAEQIDLGALFE